MGGDAYRYFVPYSSDPQRALDELRAREHAAGRFFPAVDMLDVRMSEIDPYSTSSTYPTIQDAVEAAGSTGTRSILDIREVGRTCSPGFAAPVDPDLLEELYGTAQPTHAMLEDLEFLEGVERGECVYVAVYVDGNPSELLFAGVSYD